MDADFEKTEGVAGMHCPTCGSAAPYSVTATCSMTMYQGGTELYEDVRWADDSACMCLVCGHLATVWDFRGGDAAR